jgi:hypothetical protein
MPEWLGGSALSPDMVMPRTEQWKLQWARVARWRNRVAEIKKCSRQREPSAEDVDTVIAFLQNCYHLRDWILATRADLKADLDALFNTHYELQGCRDVCNGFKHKNLKRASLDAAFNLYREYDHCDAEVNPLANPVHWMIAFAEGDDFRKYDLFDFAEQCFQIWKRFVAEKL